MDDTKTKTKTNQTTSVAVDDATVNDILLQQAQIMADTAAFHKDQLEGLKKDLAELDEKYPTPEPKTASENVPNVATEPVSMPEQVTTPVAQEYNPTYGAVPQTPSTPKPASFPTTPTGTPTF